MTMGTMGTFACIAKWKAPFLKGSRSGWEKYDLVPSGKMKTLCCTISTALSCSSKRVPCSIGEDLDALFLVAFAVLHHQKLP